MTLRSALLTALLIGFLAIGIHQWVRTGIGAGYPFLMFALVSAGLMLYFHGKDKDKKMKGECDAQKSKSSSGPKKKR